MTFEWQRRAETAIAQGSLTNSKRIETMIRGVSPTHIARGEGAYLWDAEGKKYIDFCCANGTNLFGYAHPMIKKAVRDRLEDGCLYSMGSKLEVECAELLKGQLPFVRKLRFLKTGTEACAAAVKIARAHTGRERILTAGYHGWADDFVSVTPPALGVPRRGFVESFTDIKQIKDDVAAVIIEPIVTDNSDKRLEWLKEVVRKARINGALVIFDEVITGFRWPEMTFSRWSGVYPDIICLGKAMGGGLPLSAVGLAEGIGEGKEWFVSSTFAGDTLALGAMRQTIAMLLGKFKIETLWKCGGNFLEKFNEIAPNIVKIEGYPTRGVLVGSQMNKGLFLQESHRAGVLFGPSWFFGFQHIGLEDQVLSLCGDIITRIKTGSVELIGELPKSPFAQQVRENNK